MARRASRGRSECRRRAFVAWRGPHVETCDLAAHVGVIEGVVPMPTGKAVAWLISRLEFRSFRARRTSRRPANLAADGGTGPREYRSRASVQDSQPAAAAGGGRADADTAEQSDERGIGGAAELPGGMDPHAALFQAFIKSHSRRRALRSGSARGDESRGVHARRRSEQHGAALATCRRPCAGTEDHLRGWRPSAATPQAPAAVTGQSTAARASTTGIRVLLMAPPATAQRLPKPPRICPSPSAICPAGWINAKRRRS
jgi:hypothetical protein